MEKIKANLTQVLLKNVLKVKDPVSDKLAKRATCEFFRLYFCCLLDQDLKGQCR